MICLKPSSWLASQKVDKNVQLHGRSPYGERGLKCDAQVAALDITGRSPYGERGLKSVVSSGDVGAESSLSLRRAWIEIYVCYCCLSVTVSRSPYGERGLK